MVFVELVLWVSMLHTFHAFCQLVSEMTRVGAGMLGWRVEGRENLFQWGFREVARF